MREWLSNLPIVGPLFQRELPEERRIESPSNPQLNAEREHSRRLASELAQLRESEKALRTHVEKLQSEGGSNATQLAALEEMLGDPDRAQNAIVYYQLRQVWFDCHRELAGLVEELARNMEQEERQQQLSRFKTSQEQEIRRLEDVQRHVAEEKEHLLGRRRRVEKSIRQARRIWHYFKRRRLEADLDAIAAEFKPVEQQMEDTRRHIREVQDREAPPYRGLSVEGRRRVNLAAVALSQYLYLHLRKDNVVDMARSARRKQVSEAYFGPPEECLRIMRQIREVEGRWRSDRERPDKVRRRARYLADSVTFAEEMQTVPDMRSLDYLQPSISAEGGEVSGDASPVPVNVLELDLWDIRDAMI